MNAPVPMHVYSHSRLEAFETCPLKYKLRYIDRIRPGEESIEAFMGSEVHATLEKLYKDVRMSRLDSLDDILSFHAEQWEKDWHDKVTIARKDLTRENYFETGRRCIARYYERFAPFDRGIPVWIEEHVSFELGGYKMVGVVDRMDRMPDGSYEINDYKTGGSLPGQTEMDGNRQLALYHLAVRNRWNDVRNVKLVWHFLQFGQEIISARTEEQLDNLSGDCISLIKEIEGTERFDPRPCNLCDWCEYWEYCPAKRHLVKIAGMAPAEAVKEDGFALVNEYARLKEEERKITRAAEAVRLHILDYSRRENMTWIRGSSRAVSVRVQTISGLPARSADITGYYDVERAVKAAGLWDEFAVLDTKGLLEAVQQGKLDPDLTRKIAALVQKKEIPMVKLHRLAEEDG